MFLVFGDIDETASQWQTFACQQGRIVVCTHPQFCRSVEMRLQVYARCNGYCSGDLVNIFGYPEGVAIVVLAISLNGRRKVNGRVRGQEIFIIPEIG